MNKSPRKGPAFFRLDRPWSLLSTLALSWALAGSRASAIILLSSGDPSYNTTPPGGSLTNSGWQYQGVWGSYLGTPIAPRHFITAKHVGGAVGDAFVYGGVTYTATAFYDDPASDLRIWRVCGTFESFAPLYTKSDEVGLSLVVFGRGTQRGPEVRANGVLRGWQWGPADEVERWGTNRVSGIVSVEAGIGELLQAAFDADAGAEEAHLSVGDSGGAVFIMDHSTWKLAGINYSVDGPYSTNGTGPGFSAAVFDQGGLFIGGEGNWTLVRNMPADKPGSFYATRISSRRDWINGILAQPPPPDPAPVLESAPVVAGPFVVDSAAVVDVSARAIAVPANGPQRFFRLRGCTAWRITSTRLVAEEVVLTYGD